MNCPNGCNCTLQLQKVEKLYPYNGERIIIRDLEIKVCPECGQETIPLSSMKIIESILEGTVNACFFFFFFFFFFFYGNVRTTDMSDLSD